MHGAEAREPEAERRAIGQCLAGLNGLPPCYYSILQLLALIDVFDRLVGEARIAILADEASVFDQHRVNSFNYSWSAVPSATSSQATGKDVQAI